MTQHDPALIATIVREMQSTVEPHCQNGAITPAARVAAQRLIDRYGEGAVAEAVTVSAVQIELNKLR